MSAKLPLIFIAISAIVCINAYGPKADSGYKTEIRHESKYDSLSHKSQHEYDHDHEDDEEEDDDEDIHYPGSHSQHDEHKMKYGEKMKHGEKMKNGEKMKHYNLDHERSGHGYDHHDSESGRHGSEIGRDKEYYKGKDYKRLQEQRL